MMMHPRTGSPADDDPLAAQWADRQPEATVPSLDPAVPSALVRSEGTTYERLPMLEAVFERLARRLATSMSGLLAEAVDVDLGGIVARRAGKFLEALPSPAMIVVIEAVTWGGSGLLTIDRTLVHALVDVLLGSRRQSGGARIEGRPFTAIEIALIERLVRLILTDLGAAFAPITPVAFRLERIETSPRLAIVTRPGNACVVLELRVGIGERGGMIGLLLPYATLEPARDLLLQPFTGERLGHDPTWEGHLAREVLEVGIELQAVLDDRTVRLSEAMGLEVGSVLKLGVQPQAPVVLRVGSVPVLVGQIARRGDTVVIKVEGRAERSQET